jgi:hypothetical protein
MVLINNQILLTWYWSTIKYCSRDTDQQSNTAHVILINNQILLTWYWSTIKYCSRGTDQQSNRLLIRTTWAVFDCWSVPHEQYLIVDQYHVSSIWLLISTTWTVFDCWSVPREQYLIVDQYQVGLWAAFIIFIKRRALETVKMDVTRANTFTVDGFCIVGKETRNKTKTETKTSNNQILLTW